jgi:hypothetical protein
LVVYTVLYTLTLNLVNTLTSYPLCLWAGTANVVRVTQRGGERQLAALFRLQNQFMAATGLPAVGPWPDALGFACIARRPRAQAGTRQVAEA